MLVPNAACFSAEKLWDVLRLEGKELDLMNLGSFAGEYAIVGAKYVETSWLSQGDSEVSPFLPPIVRKQLYILRVAADDTMVWRQTYPGLPDVHEIFSVDATSDQRLCIVFGEQRGQEAILNPVLLQVDVVGNILWAKRNVISLSEVNSKATESVTQIANLDTLRVIASPDNACALTFVTRQFTGETEKFQLHVIQYSPDGNIQWQQALDTEIYGKLFLINNKAANHYVVIQTNQSRDAAIQAMVLGVPFVPQTSLIGIGYTGEISYQFINPISFSNVWVKDASDAAGDSFLIAGKTKTAWVGKITSSGKVLGFFDELVGEYNAVSKAGSDGYLFARGDSVVLLKNDLKIYSNQKIKDVTTHQYVNQYLMARLADDMPVEQMISLGEDEYLVLYKLGSKLLKIRLNEKGK